MRIILFVLILAICFLGGVLYGTDQQIVVNKEVLTQQTEVEIQDSVLEESQNVENEVVMPVQSVDTPVYKAASALETVVDFFYEIVVEVLFQVSKLFY